MYEQLEDITNSRSARSIHHLSNSSNIDVNHSNSETHLARSKSDLSTKMIVGAVIGGIATVGGIVVAIYLLKKYLYQKNSNTQIEKSAHPHPPSDLFQGRNHGTIYDPQVEKEQSLLLKSA